MSRDDYLANSRAAGIYMQTFTRERQGGFSETARESSPRKGWNGEGVDEAHDVAMSLWHYTDEHFLNCRIPEDYGSPEAFASALQSFRGWLIRVRDQLQEIMDQAGDRIALTVPITFNHVKDTLFATDETLQQLAEAGKELPGGVAAVFGAAPTPMEKVQEIANRFPSVVARMRTRRSTRPPLEIADEYDVQYLFQALLGVPFLDVRPEEPTPSVAGGAGRADTLLKPERIVVEYKCTRHNLEAKELRKQIADDFLLYGAQAECDRLFVFVYDPVQKLENPEGFEDDLTRTIDGLDEVRIAVRR
ncbi:hypothetical protein KM176_06440 [Pseudooceanicola sp. CBS1P-1]|uniref:Uncharacterized protein n=1 Tax=Pseudooceanicola albus TaxID=2692189 RepID=A0A6L7G1L2_9RHOB|nr:MULTISPECIES: hypothetical protein [Pseudooceanicola]MBT9383490.1 hypothetical protein [Pseudooceanicola endophyticus]MXN17346.1 hypothetical protein [Pseudooceanicola albus]